ncbi:DUF4174 domain-containing protein [Fimbriimonas ginsengisoli]|uniref:DUF4174 domain-containing protein n=1 Tax=Fimbriimonas ginsengisoli Gsoil 348 TaxID=661478 RepID=A0A068NX58_FIMGI|nr:DUF4174 domain-containing protein [Fimbriimonas ginsengisoli]AIE87942.1 hypothetical protein OP10G_4574 [Fimbriimonas ginsengisoli Gsoil 348]
MEVSPRTLAIVAGVAAALSGLAYIFGHRTGSRREQRLNLARYRNRNRVLILFAPNRNDSRYQRQLREIAGQMEAFRDRDIAELHVLSSGPGGTVKPSDASLLRTLFNVRRGQFRVVLLGKDGATALDESSSVSASQIFDLVDEMPMRQQELRRQGVSVR